MKQAASKRGRLVVCAQLEDHNAPVAHGANRNGPLGMPVPTRSMRALELLSELLHQHKLGRPHLGRSLQLGGAHILPVALVDRLSSVEAAQVQRLQADQNACSSMS